MHQDPTDIIVYECKKARKARTNGRLDLWSALELERTNNDANGFSFPEYQPVTHILGICMGEIKWTKLSECQLVTQILSEYVTTTTSHPDFGYPHMLMLACLRLCTTNYNYNSDFPAHASDSNK